MVAYGVYVNDVAITGLMEWSYNKSITAVSDKAVITIQNGSGDGLTQITHFDDIKIYAATDALVWRGLIYDIRPKSDGSLDLICFGYMRGLMTRFHTGTYTSQSRSEIVDDLIQNYGGLITTGSITTTTGDITRTLKGISVFDAIIEMANEINYDIWVEDDLDFYFAPRGATASGYSISLTGGAVAKVETPSEGRQIYNRVLVYGDANQDGVCETVVLVEDRASQLAYGVTKEYPPIVDTSLRTEAECQARGEQIMDSYSTPVSIATIEAFGYNDVDPGETVILSGFSTSYGVDDGTYLVMERSGESKRGSQVLTLAEYSFATQDTIAELIRKMRKREYTEIDDTAASTVIMRFYETLELEGYTLRVTRVNIGNSMITGHKTNGVAGNATSIGAGQIVAGFSGRTATVDITDVET